jgi:parvulin-like peptidyl-prolyl isomerase
MTAAEVEQFIQALPPEYRAFYSGQGRRFLAVYIVRMKVLSAEAVKQKLEQQPDVALALEIARESILTDAARKHIEEGISVSDQELQDLYRKDKLLSEDVRIRHILIRTEDAPFKSGDPAHPGLPESEARKKLEDIRKRILAGADFDQMAKQYSEDRATANSGGDMGYIKSPGSVGEMSTIKEGEVMPAIANAAHALEPGHVSEVLLTPSGVEIIKVEEKHAKPFDTVRSALESQLRQSKSQDIIEHLIEQSDVFMDQEFFSLQPAAPQTPPASPPSH